ncbi:hypothetical protein M9980_04135 [Sphingomonas donggukensis]|uniref:Uncharacterized protein n=1 Tax=Sphingomonas donggukensis TaxID=2949093 RepID=A0ABY4TVT2_9SPHN|nr:hypothetical protein [Sphingomonas donggukensis]URW76417.1 hypothetical protein M9980_04135 [Sphingomonas donggukensis]
MHNVPPLYRVRIEELTSKRTVVNTIHQGPLAPVLREGGMLEAVEETDKQTFWRVSPLQRKENEYV